MWVLRVEAGSSGIAAGEPALQPHLTLFFFGYHLLMVKITGASEQVKPRFVVFADF